MAIDTPANTTTRRVLCLLIVVSSVFFKCAFGLYCYQCGITTDRSDSCQLTPDVKSFVVDCHPGDYCSKTISHRWEDDVDKQEETRGCAAPTTVSGKRHELGCHVDQRSGAVVCYCNSDHCNSAAIQRQSSAAVAVLITTLTCCVTSLHLDI